MYYNLSFMQSALKKLKGPVGLGQSVFNTLAAYACARILKFS